MIKAKPATLQDWVRMKQLYTVPNAATKMMVSKQTLYKWIERGKIEYVTMGSLNGKGGAIMIPQSEVTRIRKKGKADD